jgi:hypothetical protein
MIELINMMQSLNRWVVRKPSSGINSYHYSFTFTTKEKAIQWIKKNEFDKEIKELEIKGA